MCPKIRVSPEAHQALQARARAERRTMTATLDRLLAVAEMSTEASPMTDVPQLAPVRALRSVSMIPTDEPRCRVCGHAERRHTPACYVAGCVCRRWVAPRT